MAMYIVPIGTNVFIGGNLWGKRGKAEGRKREKRKKRVQIRTLECTAICIKLGHSQEKGG